MLKGQIGLMGWIRGALGSLREMDRRSDDFTLIVVVAAVACVVALVAGALLIPSVF